MLGSFEDAEDTAQETFLRAWRRRETFEGRRRSGPGSTGSPPTPAWTCRPSAARSPRPAARCGGCSPTPTGCSTSCPRAARTNPRPSPSRGGRSSRPTWSPSSTWRRGRGPC
ncbi:hypothetical protein MUY14_46075 [Amycolatopsis sp. FBCC-B4732]|nr:hypothetical protein MUY14_46075 [Amycolatopsis sp. FBCC-B4732]